MEDIINAKSKSLPFFRVLVDEVCYPLVVILNIDAVDEIIEVGFEKIGN